MASYYINESSIADLTEAQLAALSRRGKVTLPTGLELRCGEEVRKLVRKEIRRCAAHVSGCAK